MAIYANLKYEIGISTVYQWWMEIPVVITDTKGTQTVIILSVPSKLSINGIEKEALRRVHLYHTKLSEIIPIEVHPDVKEIYDELVEKNYLKVGETIDDLPLKTEVSK